MCRSLSSLLLSSLSPSHLNALLVAQFQKGVSRMRIGDRFHKTLQLLTNKTPISVIITCLKSTPFLESRSNRPFFESVPAMPMVHPLFTSRLRQQHQQCLSLLTSLVYERIMNGDGNTELFLLVSSLVLSDA